MKNLLRAVLIAVVLGVAASFNVRADVYPCLVLRVDESYAQEITFLVRDNPRFSIQPTATDGVYRFRVKAGATVYDFDNSWDGVHQPWVISVDYREFSGSAIDEIEREKSNDKIAVEDGVLIFSSDKLPMQIQIYSLDGKCVLSQTMRESPETISLSSLRAGVYVVKFGDKSIKLTVR